MHSTFFMPFERLVTTFWITWYYDLNQKTLLDLHEPSNEPYQADFKGLMPKKRPSRAELQKDFFRPVSRFSTEKCPDLVFAELCHDMTHKIVQMLVILSIFFI